MPLNPRLPMNATASPLGRIRRGEPSPPLAKAEKPVTAKKENPPKPPRERKGPVTLPIMPTPCPADITEAAVWHGTRLAIKLSRIPADAPASPPGQPSQSVPHANTLEAANALAKACGFEETRTLKRGRCCFWECVEIVMWFYAHEKDTLLRGAALEIVAETVRAKIDQIHLTSPATNADGIGSE